MDKEQDICWLRKAFEVANLYSQDANSQTGAVIIDPETQKIISFGANRIHYGFKDRFEGEGNKKILGRPEKYTDLVHAERDAIYSANRKGISLVEKTIYATWTPCIQCAELILNNGIKRFVTHNSTDQWYKEARKTNSDRNDWTNAIEKAVSLFKQGGVSYEIMTSPIGNIEFIFDDVLRHP